MAKGNNDDGIREWESVEEMGGQDRLSKVKCKLNGKRVGAVCIGCEQIITCLMCLRKHVIYLQILGAKWVFNLKIQF